MQYAKRLKEILLCFYGIASKCSCCRNCICSWHLLRNTYGKIFLIPGSVNACLYLISKSEKPFLFRRQATEDSQIFHFLLVLDLIFVNILVISTLIGAEMPKNCYCDSDHYSSHVFSEAPDSWRCFHACATTEQYPCQAKLIQGVS